MKLEPFIMHEVVLISSDFCRRYSYEKIITESESE